MKQYRYNPIYRGIQIEAVVCAKSAKRVADILDISSYYVRNYVSITDTLTPECEKHPEIIFAMVDYGGELLHAQPELRRKLMPLDEMKAIIDEHRSKYFSYQDFLDKRNKENDAKAAAAKQ